MKKLMCSVTNTLSLSIEAWDAFIRRASDYFTDGGGALGRARRSSLESIRRIIDEMRSLLQLLKTLADKLAEIQTSVSLL